MNQPFSNSSTGQDANSHTSRLRTARRRLALLALTLFTAAGVQAQSTITWGTPTAIAGDSDVAISGTLVYAYTESGAGATVNGVSFAPGNSASSLGSDVTLGSFDSVDNSTYLCDNPIGLSADYQTVVKGGAYNGGSTATITLNNLASGRSYLVQFWVCDYRGNGCGASWAANSARNQTLTAGNTSGTLTYLQADGSGNNLGAFSGTYVIGTFTASGTTQTITISPNASAQMNAIQVRQLPLSFSGTGTVRMLATDWADYTGGSSTFNVNANDGGRLYWRNDANAGDGQYIHFNLARLSGLTINSSAAVTLQKANPTWGASVTDSFIAKANGTWTAAYGASIPGATAIDGAVNATGDYVSGASVTWSIGTSTFQGYVDNASSFNGLAIIGGPNSRLHFDGPMNPYLEVLTDATMSGVVTVAGGGTWNASNYAFNNGVLSINDSVGGGGNVTINPLGTVFVNGNSGDNRYWDIGSTRINTGGVLMMEGHSHIHNLTLAGGELAGIRPNGSWGSWSFDDATTVTGNTTSTISAQQMNFDNGNFTVDTGSTLNMSGSIRSGSITKAGAGTMVLTGYNSSSGGTTINGGVLNAARSKQDHGIHTLGSGPLTINNGGTLRSTAQWSTSSEWNPGTTVGAITINQSGTWAIEAVGQTILNGLYLNGGSITATVANGDWGALHLKSGVTAGDGVTPTTSSVAADTALSGTQTMTVNDGSQLNYSGVIHNQHATSSGITKAGTGTLVLSGANSYSGQTDITAGTLVAASSTALGTGGHNGSTMSWVRDGATLALQGGISLDEHFHVWSSGVGGLGAVRSLSGNNALTDTDGGGGPGYCLRSDTTVGVDADTLTVSGFYQDGGSWGLTKVGAGTLVLNAPGTYTGNTLITAGKIALGNALALQNSAFDTASVNGGLDVTGYPSPTLGGLTGSANLSSTLIIGYGSVTSLSLNPQTGSSVTYSGSITDGATGMALTKSGAGTQTLSGNNNYTGATTINGGTLAFTGGTSTIGNLNNSGGNLTFSGSSVVTGGTLHFENYNPQLTISGNADVTLTGGITHRVSTLDPFDPYHAANYIFTGGTLHTPSISGPSISWRQDNASMHFDGTRIVATTDNANFITTIGWDHTDIINLGATSGAIFDTDGYDIGLQVRLADDPNNPPGQGGKLTKFGTGTLTLSAHNTYSGTTTVDSGILLVNGSIGSGAVSVVSGATLGGSGTISGAVTVNSGGTLAPGATIGTLTLGASPTLGGTLAMEINKTAATADKLALGANALTLGGALIVSQSDAGTFANGDSFILLETSGSRSGWFSSVTLPALPVGLTWDTNRVATEGVLEVYNFTTNAVQTMVALKNTPTTLKISKLTGKTINARGAVVLQSVSASSAHGNNNVGISGADITYTPPTDFTGTDTFTAVLGDGHGSITATVVVTVSEANVGPSITPANVGGYGSFTASGMPSTAYIIQISTNLPGWSDYTNITSAANGVISYTDPISIIGHGGQVYYRLKQQ